MPSRICPFSREALGSLCISRVRMRDSAKMVAPKLMPLMMNTQPVPTAAISRPATPGPISRAALNDALLRPTAFESLSLGTISATNV
ncbi:hypothetical protein D3C74_364840 [compost metagenome]